MISPLGDLVSSKVKSLHKLSASVWLALPPALGAQVNEPLVIVLKDASTAPLLLTLNSYVTESPGVKKLILKKEIL